MARLVGNLALFICIITCSWQVTKQMDVTKGKSPRYTGEFQDKMAAKLGLDVGKELENSDQHNRRLDTTQAQKPLPQMRRAIAFLQNMDPSKVTVVHPQQATKHSMHKLSLVRGSDGRKIHEEPRITLKNEKRKRSTSNGGIHSVGRVEDDGHTKIGFGQALGHQSNIKYQEEVDKEKQEKEQYLDEWREKFEEEFGKRAQFVRDEPV